MDEFDGLVSYYATAKFPIFDGEDVLPTTDAIIWDTLAGSDDVQGNELAASTLSLYGNGCKTDHNEINCTKACGDRQLLFQDWQTQWNCLTLTKMASSKLNPHGFNHVNATGDTREVLGHLGITKLTEFDAVGVLEKYFVCANQSCSPENVQACYAPWPTLVGPKGQFDIREVGMDLVAMCTFSYDEQNNPDLGGPGVICSYIMSTFIVLYAWICIRTLHIASSIDWFVRFTRYRGKIYSFVTFHRSRLALRLEHSTSIFAAEMQEAQCFFIFAVQVAVIYANSQSPSFLGGDTWQALVNNRYTLKGLAVIAALPLLLNQIILNKVRLDSVYSLSLCTIVFIMAYVASLTSVDKDFDKAYDIFKSPDGLGKCGKLSSLTALCGSASNDYMLNQPRFLMDLCSTTLSILWFKKLWREFAGAQKFRNYARILSQKKNPATLYIIQFGLLSMTVFVFASEVIFVVYMAYNFIVLYDLLVGGSSYSAWSIGQVISVLVWAPAISKYLYLLIFGIERGLGVRISTAFAVIRKPRQLNEHGSSIDEDNNSTQGLPTA
ncbi:hypothetical protein V8C37DRAFT_377063 [Trichoderma ceciliae]